VGTHTCPQARTANGNVSHTQFGSTQSAPAEGWPATA
jgi:hypothetical protein